MTDKEIKKLSRSDLLEILFYMREELDSLKLENESLKVRIDELTRPSENVISDDIKAEIANIVKEAVESCMNQQRSVKNNEEQRDDIKGTSDN